MKNWKLTNCKDRMGKGWLNSSHETDLGVSDEHKLPRNTRGGGPKKNQNYLLEGGTLVVQASPGKWVFEEPICIGRPPGIVVRGCVWLQWIFLKTQCFCPFHHGWFRSAPAYTTLRVQHFLTKDNMTPRPCLILPIHPISSQLTFFVSQDEESPQKKTFYWCGWGETKKLQKH